MRLAAVIVCAFALAASASAGTVDKRVSAGKLVVTDARGKIVLTGSGVLIGRLVSGTIEIKDLSPADSFSPRLNGVPRGKLVRHRGKDVGFIVPAGRYRIVVRGEGISLSARGTGVIALDGEPDSVGATGTFAIDDEPATPLPDEPTRAQFGKLPDEPSTDPKKSGGTSAGGTRPTP
jgi:hypothetical protein